MGAVKTMLDGATEPDGVEWEALVSLDQESGPPFPVDLLPPVVRVFVEEVAEALQVAVDLPAMLCLGAVAGVIGGKFHVRANRGWLEPTCEYIVGVLPSGENKSAALAKVMDPVMKRQEELARLAKPENARGLAERGVLEAKLHNAKQLAAKGKCPLKDVATLAQDLAQFNVPSIPQLVGGGDTTPESLVKIMAENGGRLAVVTAEGGLFDILAGRYSDGVPNLDPILQAYTEDVIDSGRVGRAREFIKRPALTLVATIQPVVLSTLGANRIMRDRGLLPRISFFKPVSLVGFRNPDAAPVTVAAETGWAELMSHIQRFPVLPEAERYVLTLSPGALRLFQENRAALEIALRPGNGLQHIADWGLRLHGKVFRASAALLLMEHGGKIKPWDEPISATTMAAAIAIGEYLRGHALVAFGLMGADPALEGARRIHEWIVRTRLQKFTSREVWQATRGHFKEAQFMKRSLELLCEYGYLREHLVQREGAGRPPAPSYEVNPRVCKEASGRSTSAMPVLEQQQGREAWSGVA